MTNASVVIVNYNSGQFLEACIDSVCRSDCSLEIIVVDNGSTDGSADFLRNLMVSNVPLHVIRNMENHGFSAGVNRGIRDSISENILLLNPDCLVLPHTIRSLCAVLDADASAGIVGGLVFNFDGSEQQGCRRREPTLARSLGKVLQSHSFSIEWNQVDMSDEPLPEKPIYVDAVSGSFLMIRRTTIFDVGGMDEDFFLHFEDLDLCRRVRDGRWKVVFVPEISIFHYQGGSSEHSGPHISWQKHRSMWRYQCKHHGRKPWLRALVFLIVWGHFLIQRTKWIVKHGLKSWGERQGSLVDWTGLSRMTALIGSEKGNRLLVLGPIDEPVRDMLHFGTTIGWSIYARKEVEDAERTADVHLLHPEYFDKVSARDAPEFDAVLIQPSLSFRGAVDRMVDKFRISRVAIIQLTSLSDKSNADDAAKSVGVKQNKETLADEVMKDKTWYQETRLFSLPSSKSGREDHAVGAQWDKTIQDCFSWLSK